MGYVVIEISDGLLTSVHADEELQVVLVDWDNIKEGGCSTYENLHGDLAAMPECLREQFEEATGTLTTCAKCGAKLDADTARRCVECGEDNCEECMLPQSEWCRECAINLGLECGEDYWLGIGE